MFTVRCSGPKYMHPHSWIDRAYIEKYDPEWNRGEGRAWFTYDIAKAVLFDTLERAVGFVQQVPANKRFTDAGIINRPLDCFEIEYQPVRGPVPRYRQLPTMPQVSYEQGQTDYNAPWWKLGPTWTDPKDHDPKRGRDGYTLRQLHNM